MLHRSVQPRLLYDNARTILRLLYRNAPYWVKGAPDGLPIPPGNLRTLIWSKTADIRVFLQGREAPFLLAVLTRHGVNINDFQAILDFGCGAGRVTRQFRHLKQAKVYGTDINPEQIDWCRRNLPFAQFDVNQAFPPLIYSADKFDLIYAISIFIHLPESLQLLWINELSRVLKPGGYLLITTCGDAYFESLTQEEREQFRADQLIVRHEELAGSPSTYFGCVACHPVVYVKEKLAKGFEIIQFFPGDPIETGPQGNMDYYFFKKPINAPSAR